MAVEALLTAGGKWPTLPFPTFMYAGKDCSAVTWCASWDLPFRWEGTEQSTEEEGRQDMEKGYSKTRCGVCNSVIHVPSLGLGQGKADE